MAPNLRARGGRGNVRSAARGAERCCPVCMEEPHTEHDWFCFPCGHGICVKCNEQMIARRFLACPTCRTPREGVSEQQVQAANQARVDVDAFRDSGWEENVVPNAGRYEATIFFPDESGGANPFGPLSQAIGPPIRTPFALAPAPEGDDDEALAQVLQAQEMVGVHLPQTQTTSARTAVSGPMRDLVDRLLSTAPISEFLAHRELVRRPQSGGGARSLQYF
ncbi:MAG: hypothetical protein CMB11_04785 [Euryarchaeota archaeon]|nr:hypothetical protein [Euryarchaeota archaeon]